MDHHSTRMRNSHSHCRMEFPFPKGNQARLTTWIVSQVRLLSAQVTQRRLGCRWTLHAGTDSVRVIPDVLNFVSNKHMESSCFICNVYKDNSAVRPHHF